MSSQQHATPSSSRWSIRTSPCTCIYVHCTCTPPDRLIMFMVQYSSCLKEKVLMFSGLLYMYVLHNKLLNYLLIANISNKVWQTLYPMLKHTNIIQLYVKHCISLSRENTVRQRFHCRTWIWCHLLNLLVFFFLLWKRRKRCHMHLLCSRINQCRCTDKEENKPLASAKQHTVTQPINPGSQ